MTDRELLELAAKAAVFGDGKFCWTQSEYPRGSGICGALWNYRGHADAAELWNPLTDDGDAFALASKLCLHIIFYPWGAMVQAESVANQKDPRAAARRAVVMAAAEIARMQAQ